MGDCCSQELTRKRNEIPAYVEKQTTFVVEGHEQRRETQNLAREFFTLLTGAF